MSLKMSWGGGPEEHEMSRGGGSDEYFSVDHWKLNVTGRRGNQKSNVEGRGVGKNISPPLSF